jgi:PAS domain S-box-containing protein
MSTNDPESVHLIEVRSLAGDPDCVHRVLKQIPTDSGMSFLVTCEDRRKSLDAFRDEVQAISGREVVVAVSGESVDTNVVYVIHEGLTVWVRNCLFILLPHDLEQLGAAIEPAPIGFVVTDQAGKIVLANSQTPRLFGYNRTELLGEPLEILLSETQAAPKSQEFGDMSDSVIRRTGERLDLLAKHRSGKTFPIELGLCPIRYSDQRYVLAAIIDLTERNAAFDAMRESESRFERAVRGTADGIWEWTVGTDSVYYSPRFARLLGFEPAEYVDTLKEFLARLHKDDYQPTWDAVQDHLEKGTPYDVQYRVKCQDGQYRWFRARGVADRDADGQPTRMAGSISDIDARKQAEHRLQTLLDNSPAIIHVKDLTGRYLDINQHGAAFFQVSRDQLIGKTDYDFFPPDVATVLRNNDRHVAEERTTIRLEEEFVYRDKRTVMLSVRYPLYDANGEMFATAGISTELTEQKRLEESIREQVRQRDYFLAMLSHELRNPLAALVSASHQLAESALPVIEPMLQEPTKVPVSQDAVDDAKDALEVISRQTLHMKRMLDDLLEVSRMTQNRMVMQNAPFDILTTIPAVLECVNDRIAAKMLVLTVEKPDEPVFVFGDAARAQQAQVNLLTNAIRFTPANGKIVFRFTVDHDHVNITVSDTGVGLSLEALSRVFDVFYQTEQRADRPLGGLGVGLPLTRFIAQKHGGTLSASSNGVNQGAVFTLRLPISDLRPEVVDQPVVTDIKAKNLLLVEDNQDMRRMLAKTLKRRGFTVSMAANGLDAVEQFKKVNPDVAIIDIGLPDMNGFEVARTLRGLEEGDAQTKPALLIALTGYGQEEDRRMSQEAGFNLHLTKPIDPVDIVSEIAKAESARAQS